MVAHRWFAKDMPLLTNQIAVVTGANSGVGFHTALELARKEAHVVLACRSQERGLKAQQDIREQTGNTDVWFMQVDMGSLESIREFSTKFHERFDHLDILVNNAGVMNAQFESTSDGFEAHFGVNSLGPFLMTSLLFDRIKVSKAARIINVSSLAYTRGSADWTTYGYPPHPKPSWTTTYGTSKLAINLFTFELHRRLQAAGLDNVKSIVVHPGVSITNLLPYPKWVLAVIRFLTGWIFNPREWSALPSLYAASDPSVESGEFFGPNGWGELRGTPTRVQATEPSHSQEDATKFWIRSEELVHTRFDVAK